MKHAKRASVNLEQSVTSMIDDEKSVSSHENDECHDVEMAMEMDLELSIDNDEYEELAVMEGNEGVEFTQSALPDTDALTIHNVFSFDDGMMMIY